MRARAGWPIAAAWSIEPLLEAGPASGVARGWASSSCRHRRGVERLGLREQCLEAVCPPELTTSSGSWPAGSSTKRRVRSGRDVGEGAKRGADRGLAAGAVAVEAEDRRRIEPPHALELGFGDRGAVGRDDFGDAGAVEGDHVHIAFHHDQPLGGAAGGSGAIDVVESPALVEERRVGRIQVLRLACPEDAPAECDDPAPRVADRDHQPSTEAVVAVLVRLLGLDQHPGLDQLVLAEVGEGPLEALRLSGAKPMPKRRRSPARCRGA